MGLIVSVKRDDRGEFRWYARDDENGETMGSSSEGYEHKHDCVHGGERVIGVDRTDVRWEIDE